MPPRLDAGSFVPLLRGKPSWMAALRAVLGDTTGCSAFNFWDLSALVGAVDGPASESALAIFSTPPSSEDIVEGCTQQAEQRDVPEIAEYLGKPEGGCGLVVVALAIGPMKGSVKQSGSSLEEQVTTHESRGQK